MPMESYVQLNYGPEIHNFDCSSCVLLLVVGPSPAKTEALRAKLYLNPPLKLQRINAPILQGVKCILVLARPGLALPPGETPGAQPTGL